MRRAVGLVPLVLLLSGCPKSQTRVREIRPLVLEFVDSLRLAAPAIGLARDRDELLLVEQTGTNVLRLGRDLTVRASLPIPNRLPGVRGLAAGPFAVHLYDDSRVYRLDRSSGTMSAVSSNIRCQSALALSSGQLAVADGYSNRVLLFEPDAGVSDLGLAVPDFRPIALAFGRDNNFYILNQTRQEVLVLNRVGEPSRVQPLPEPGIRLAVDDSLNTYVLERAGSRVWQLGRRGSLARTGSSEPGLDFVATEMVTADSELFLLDRGRRVLKFRIPGGPN